MFSSEDNNKFEHVKSGYLNGLNNQTEPVELSLLFQEPVNMSGKLANCRP